jgi:hypothetical protein
MERGQVLQRLGRRGRERERQRERKNGEQRGGEGRGEKKEKNRGKQIEGVREGRGDEGKGT